MGSNLLCLVLGSNFGWILANLDEIVLWYSLLSSSKFWDILK
jgi:hypothetical protein